MKKIIAIIALVAALISAPAQAQVLKLNQLIPQSSPGVWPSGVVFSNGIGTSTLTAVATSSLGIGDFWRWNSATDVLRPASTTTSVAIGSTTAERLLHVYGDQTQGVAIFERTNSTTTATVGTVKIKATTSGTSTDNFGPAFQFYYQDNDGTEQYLADIRGIRSGADTSGALTFSTRLLGTTAEHLRITPAGDVNIGTTTGTAKFTIQGTAGSNKIISAASSTGSELFSIDHIGVARFNSQAGSSGQVLQSNGTTAAPTWVATSSLGTGQVGSGTANQFAYYGTTGTTVSGQSVLTVNTGTSLVTLDGNLSLTPTAGVNRQINFGVGLGSTALMLYNGGTNLNWGWGLEGGRMVFYGVQSGGNSFVWRNGGALTGGSNVATLTLGGVFTTLSTIQGTKLGAGMVPVSFVDVLGTAANATVGVESTIRTARSTTGGQTWGQAFEIMVGRWKTPTSFSPDTRVDFKLKHNSDGTLSGDTTVMTMQSNTRVAIGTTTASANLHVQGVGGEIFRVASSTTAVLFSIGTDGALFTGGSTPTVSSCGGTPSITGNVSAGTVTTGTSSPTSCVVTFPTTLLGTPEVMINMATTTVFGAVTSKSTSSFTVTFFNAAGSTAYQSGVFNYHVLTR